MSLNPYIAEILDRFGYDPADPVRGLDVPENLVRDLGDCPCPPPFKGVAYCPDCPCREEGMAA